MGHVTQTWLIDMFLLLGSVINWVMDVHVTPTGPMLTIPRIWKKWKKDALLLLGTPVWSYWVLPLPPFGDSVLENEANTRRDEKVERNRVLMMSSLETLDPAMPETRPTDCFSVA